LKGGLGKNNRKKKMNLVFGSLVGEQEAVLTKERGISFGGESLITGGKHRGESPC